jgi:hypothetical protein
MRKRLWVALAAQLILASSCSTQDIPDAGSGSVRPPGTPSPPPTGPGTPASTPPHEREIAAANHHGLGFTVTPDTTPPSPVTDLAFANLLPTDVNVQWTASGDDGAIGTAASYDLRWSTSPITPENFAAATPIPTGTPRPPGTVETAAFIVPPQSPVFVALVVADEESNVSPLSNVISGTTPAGEQVFVETVEGDTSKWTAKGLWHVTTRRAADGSHAFWYGRESTGTYDTPDLSNDGDLISPIIDLSGVNSPVLVFDQFIITEDLFSFDLAQVIVTDVDAPSHTLTFEKDTTFSTAFVARVLTLSGFDGKRVKLTFRFSTLDAVNNAFEGWYVDHLRILGSVACAHDGTVCEGCAHDACNAGDPLASTCDSCATSVCAADPYCCTTGWDSRCVQEAANGCGLACTVCTHSLCSQGTPLETTCDPCAGAVCAADPYCCNNTWDQRCIDESQTTCGLTCATERSTGAPRTPTPSR